ncbi:hypothetical protein OH76DRAFT_1451580 [Lentinus brumalis]|uniref:Transmembrane protein n=1 Tax=Lentinus brumalis TaxID=2498619 RepID=A0A371DV75_9APHY|nr:hypothetical protein OH76DRAFT_1451580 [Polyporus brumalis]
MTPITSQPYATNAPVVAVYEYSNEKGCSHAQEGHPRESRRCQCNRARASQSRRILAAVLLAALSIVLFALAWGLWDAVFNEGSWLSSFGWGEDGTGSAWSALGGFVKRQANGPAGNGGNTFVDRKYYLIVVFVGLVLVILAAICLSAWCCRGAFENPLCCPCYLCACCGGLACLECIGCGLCAEGIDNM